MARNLRDMKKSGARPGPQNNETPAAQPTVEQRAGVNELVNEYGGKSEEELMGELFRVTGEQKKNGSFDPAAMRRTAESIMPMLTPEQRNKLMSIIWALSE
ncbi:MAG: hypothetical protein IKO51_10655 [Clostridia bacterium]|nr:hypothetical protein [Clostridia bacterium]